jgi:hypothetical protein
MFVGVLLIIASFILAATGNSSIAPTLIGPLAAAVAEFIGATFLLLYRSTVKQSVNYVKLLENINIVGMSSIILDTISDESLELRNTTKAEIAKLVLTQKFGEQNKTEK